MLQNFFKNITSLLAGLPPPHLDNMPIPVHTPVPEQDL